MSIDVSNAIAQLTARTTAGPKQVKFAARVALTRSIVKAKGALEHEMRDVFSNPTPFTMSSLYVRPATATNLSAEVKLKDFAAKATPASKFLSAQIKGGQRSQKRFERALQSVGALPPGYRIVPGAAAKLDSYGNMSRGQIVQILAFFRAFPEAGYKANMTSQGRAKLARGSKSKQGFAYFAGRPGDRLPLGIYQRITFARGSAIKPVMIFVRSAIYQPTLDFEYVAEKTIQTEFAGEFVRAFAEAVRTAR
ncbi:MAG: hypothetical protein WA191_05090 [Telluria sp.]